MVCMVKHIKQRREEQMSTMADDGRTLDFINKLNVNISYRVILLPAPPTKS